MSEKKRAARPHESEPGKGSHEDRVSEAPVAPGAPGAPDTVDWKAQAEEIRDRWLRAEAELQNFRRRAARDRDEARRLAEEAVWMEMLAVADDLERALANRPSGAEAEAWSDGVALVVRRIREYLRRQGIDVVDPLGEPFDPSLHEAVLEVDGGDAVPPGAVAEVVGKGYRRGDRALRPARVVVARQGKGRAGEDGTDSARG